MYYQIVETIFYLQTSTLGYYSAYFYNQEAALSNAKRNSLKAGSPVFLPRLFVSFFFQNRVLNGVLIDWFASRVIDKGDKFSEDPFAPHPQPFAELLARSVGVFGVGIDPSGPLFIEQVIKESMRCLIGTALAKVILVQHPAGAEGIEHGIFSRMRLPAFRVGTNLADHLARFLEDNREKILGFLCPLDHFFPCFIKGFQLYVGEAVNQRLVQVFVQIFRVALLKRTQKQSFCLNHHFSSTIFLPDMKNYEHGAYRGGEAATRRTSVFTLFGKSKSDDAARF